MSKIKKEIFYILHTSYGRRGWQYKIDDYFITSLIVLNVFAIILETNSILYHHYETYFHYFELFSVAIFSLEYILRIWVSDLNYRAMSPLKARLKYIFSALGIIDLLAVIPFYLPLFISMDLRTLRSLRLFRLFRIFKLAHYSSSLRLVAQVINKKKQVLSITVASTFIIIMLAASIMFELEHDLQPEKFPDIFGAFWWAIATLTTIGYGDVYPMTGLGQILAAITALFGIGLVAIPTGIVSVGFLEEISKNKSEQEMAEHRNYILHKRVRKAKKKVIKHQNKVKARGKRK